MNKPTIGQIAFDAFTKTDGLVTFEGLPDGEKQRWEDAAKAVTVELQARLEAEKTFSEAVKKAHIDFVVASASKKVD